jgi:hypothetical protein
MSVDYSTTLFIDTRSSLAKVIIVKTALNAWALMG